MKSVFMERRWNRAEIQCALQRLDRMMTIKFGYDQGNNNPKKRSVK